MGSQLMRKMGWVGAGLGASEQGRVELVTVGYIPAYPGMSLDMCMRFRDNCGKGGRQNVEKNNTGQHEITRTISNPQRDEETPLSRVDSAMAILREKSQGVARVPCVVGV